MQSAMAESGDWWSNLYERGRGKTVSIITPSLNPDRRLVEACESLEHAIAMLKRQDYEIRIEQIICDDSSTEPGTSELYARLEQGFPFIRVIRNTSEHRGPAAARNYALEHARGEWVGFLDADDQMVPEGFMHLIQASRQHPESEWIVGDSVAFHTDGQEIMKPSRFRKVCLDNHQQPIYVSSEIVMSVLAGPPNLFLGAMMAKKSLIEKAGGFDVQLLRSEDWYLTLSMAEFSGVIYVPTTVLRFRRGESSLTQSPGKGEVDTVRATWRAMTERRFRSVRRVLRWTLISQMVFLRDGLFAQRRRGRAFWFGLL